MSEAGLVSRIRFGLKWRLPLWRRKVLRAFGVTDTQWARVIMDRETARFVGQLDAGSLAALEISGTKWRAAGFRHYESVGFPEYDVCATAYKLGHYDVILAEQVLEHVLWPYRAVRHIHEMLKPGGVAIVTTPFLLRLHDCPVDCSRWTELGMKHLLAEGGFPLDEIVTGSWGNRACVRANFRRWADYVPWKHSLRNEPDYPVVIWAFARKAKT